MTWPDHFDPILLEADAPAPRRGILIPAAPRPADRALSWTAIAVTLRAGRRLSTATYLDRIARLANQPRPLQKGDRVTIGGIKAVVQTVSATGYPGFVYVQYVGDRLTDHRVPIAVCTRDGDTDD